MIVIIKEKNALSKGSSIALTINNYFTYWLRCYFDHKHKIIILPPQIKLGIVWICRFGDNHNDNVLITMGKYSVLCFLVLLVHYSRCQFDSKLIDQLKKNIGEVGVYIATDDSNCSIDLEVFGASLVEYEPWAMYSK